MPLVARRIRRARPDLSRRVCQRCRSWNIAINPKGQRLYWVLVTFSIVTPWLGTDAAVNDPVNVPRSV
jgi:hypothetical protein